MSQFSGLLPRWSGPAGLVLEPKCLGYSKPAPKWPGHYSILPTLLTLTTSWFVNILGCPKGIKE